MNRFRILTTPILFSSLLGLPFSWITLLRNLKLKTYNLQLSTRVPHPWFVRRVVCAPDGVAVVGSCALTPPILFFSLLGLPFSWVTLFRNLKLKTYNLQLSTPRRLFA
jgi:hypothetical protein